MPDKCDQFEVGFRQAYRRFLCINWRLHLGDADLTAVTLENDELKAEKNFWA